MPEPYGDLAFWKKKYEQNRPQKEAYGGYEEFKTMLGLYLKEETRGRDRILHLGCGLSSLAPGLWSDGWTSITSVDFCASAVEQCRERDKHMHGLEYLCMDCSNMDAFPDSSFDYVVDKGFLDSAFCNLGCLRNVSQTLSEISRLLKPGGYFISISGAPRDCRFPHLMRPKFEWNVDCVRASPSEPAFYAYACRKRSFHREWFFADESALAVAEGSKRVYVAPVRGISSE